VFVFSVVLFVSTLFSSSIKQMDTWTRSRIQTTLCSVWDGMITFFSFLISCSVSVLVSMMCVCTRSEWRYINLCISSIVTFYSNNRPRNAVRFLGRIFPDCYKLWICIDPIKYFILVIYLGLNLNSICLFCSSCHVLNSNRPLFFFLVFNLNDWTLHKP